MNMPLPPTMIFSAGSFQGFQTLTVMHTRILIFPTWFLSRIERFLHGKKKEKEPFMLDGVYLPT